jgi:beta-galactosidase
MSELSATEDTALLFIDNDDDEAMKDSDSKHLRLLSPVRRKILAAAIFVVLVGVGVALIVIHPSTKKPTSADSGPVVFPKDFVWGAATSSYQIEGAAAEDGRGLSIWDTYCALDGKIADGSSGAVACDHYHRVQEDIQLLKALNIRAYRFSIAWPRILPNGTGNVNPAGIAFYNQLIDLLLENNMEPWVTLYHWDLPQTLEDRYEGWQGREIVDDFANYAKICFQAFGDRVQHWITLNEAWTVAVQAYNDGTKAPGKTDNPSIKVYRAGHHLVLAHARAATIYKEEFAPTQKGQIGIANCGDFRYPKTDTQDDQLAADRAMIFQYAWLTDPFFVGDYPVEMRERLGDRLPHFTDEERQEMIGANDFLGLNHYSTLYASLPKETPAFGGYWADMNVEFSSDPSWRKNFMGWSTNPDGCRELLLWISNRYKGVTIVMTENGTSEDEPDLATSLRDEGRRLYFEGYLRACAEAIALGVNLAGYFAWSLMDNFEWEYGYTRRFGICHVDFETQVRTPKSSALWYSETIQANGRNIPKMNNSS